jgi:toxin ParE1/3/4
MTFRVRPEARADIFDAAQWYEDREPGLGVAFIAEIDAAFQRIELGYTLIYRQLRRVLVHRCPYAVYFGVDAADIVIFAVLHQRRAPKILDDRLDHPSG